MQNQKRNECRICPVHVILRDLIEEKIEVIRLQKVEIRRLTILTQLKIDYTFGLN